MFKKSFLLAGIISLFYMVACSSNETVAGGTIDPNAFAEASSSSAAKDGPVENSSSSHFYGEDPIVESSSSHIYDVDPIIESSSSSVYIDVDPIVVSSSSEGDKDKANSSDSNDNMDIRPIPASSSSDGRKNIVMDVRNFSAQCVDDAIYENRGEPIVATDLPTPEAHRVVEGDSVNVTLLNVRFDIPCNVDQRNSFLEDIYAVVGLVEDSLYVSIPRIREMTYGCACIAKVDFMLDKEVSGFDYAVFDAKDVVLVKE